MTLTFHALLMLCGLAAPAFGAAGSCSRRWLSLASAAAGFAAAALWFGSGRPLDVAQAGTLVALAAAFQLLRPQKVAVAAVAAGAAAGVWMSMLRVQGTPWAIAAVLGSAPYLCSWHLAATRPRFAPALVREEALLAVLALALAVATAPSILDGWRAAVALNIQGSPNGQVGAPNGSMMPAWTLGILGGSVALGGLYSVWRRG